MGISTTPVKEALRRPEQDGLVVSQPRRGAVVGPLVLTPAAEILEIRAHLEALGARLAAEKLTPGRERALAAELEALEALHATDGISELVAEATNAFHHSIRDGAGNEFLRRLLDTLAPSTARSGSAPRWTPGRQSGTESSMRAIGDAILAGDGDTAERVMYEHIHRVIAIHARGVVDSDD
jgi:DNA-binding GntR family transcriptional regulator